MKKFHQNKSILIISGLLILTFSLSACQKETKKAVIKPKSEPVIDHSKHNHMDMEKEKTMPTNEVNNEENVIVRTVVADEVGVKTICPVMGKQFTVKNTTQVGEYKNQKVYFCCSGCIFEFKKNPEKYI